MSLPSFFLRGMRVVCVLIGVVFVFVCSANRTLVPIRCRVVKNLSDFEGAWTVSTGFL